LLRDRIATKGLVSAALELAMPMATHRGLSRPCTILDTGNRESPVASACGHAEPWPHAIGSGRRLSGEAGSVGQRESLAPVVRGRRR